jgi:hypothetical protein
MIEQHQHTFFITFIIELKTIFCENILILDSVCKWHTNIKILIKFIILYPITPQNKIKVTALYSVTTVFEFYLLYR